MCALPLSDPEAQTDGFVCPICAQPLDLEIPQHVWQTMGNNNAFGHLWNHMLPRGLVFGQYLPLSDGTFVIEPVPKYIHVDAVQQLYTPMHSRCFRDKRHAWVQMQQAACTCAYGDALDGPMS